MLRYCCCFFQKTKNSIKVPIKEASIKDPILSQLSFAEIEKIKNKHYYGELTLTSLMLNDTQVAELVDALNQNEAITSIDLSNNFIGDEAVKSLITLKFIKQLDLSHNQITDRGQLHLSTKFGSENINVTGMPISSITRSSAF
jgi:Leucine-rich repeat (LRR) protein